MPKYGLLLVNLGTPDSHKVSDVRRYLRQFLSDPRVLDIPSWLRFLLLNIVILPTRPRASAKAYSKIWQEQGSPLMIHTQALAKSVTQYVDCHVEVAMRYANPSIKRAILNMQQQKVEQIYVLPLFPQYASSSYGSALAEIYCELAVHDYVIPVTVKAPYYSAPDFIEVLAAVTKSQLKKFDYLLMSFHGLPERHVIRSDGGNNCDLRGPCPKINASNMSCYRAQCYTTARLLANSLGVDSYGVAFQSRLGRTPWIQPYTDEILVNLRQQGHSKLAVVCPSFTADCLETLEEIGMELKQNWLDLGGESFQLIDCLNSDERWAKLIANWVRASIANSD